MPAILARHALNASFLLVAATASTLAQPAPPAPPAPGAKVAPAIPKAPSPVRCMRPIYQGHASIDRATGVAKAKVVALRWREIELAILDQVKGTVATKVVARGSSCMEESLAVGDSVLVLTDASGSLVDTASEGLIPLADPRVPSLVTFAQATTPAARTKALVAAIAKSDAGSEAAAGFLAGSGNDLNALTKQQRTELVRAAEKSPTRDLAIALARLRIELAPTVYEKVGLKDDSVARAIVAIRDFEKIDDPMRLAELIKVEADPNRQMAAYERCDRVSDKPGSNSMSYTLRSSTKYMTPTRMMVSMCSRGRVTMPPTSTP